MLISIFILKQGIHRLWETWETWNVMGFNSWSQEVMGKPVKSWEFSVQSIFWRMFFKSTKR